jgi:hypothetical protein
MMFLTHFGVVIGIASAIFGMMAAILGYIVKGVARLAVMGAKVDRVEEAVKGLTNKLADVIVDVAVASHTDVNLEARVRELETRRR